MTADIYKLETAACLWEQCVQPSYDSCLQVDGYLATAGWSATRMKVLELVDHCDETFKVAQEIYGFDYPFDWEFCPRYLKLCIDDDLNPNCTPEEAACKILEEFGA